MVFIVVVRTISTEWTTVFHISLLGAANTIVSLRPGTRTVGADPVQSQTR